MIDKSGKLYVSDGSASNVSIEGIDLTEATITHNHPPDENGFTDSFGKDDFMFLSDHPEIKEMRAVNEKYTYSLRLLKPLDISYNEVECGGYDLAIKSGNYNEPQHNAMEWLKRRDISTMSENELTNEPEPSDCCGSRGSKAKIDRIKCKRGCRA